MISFIKGEVVEIYDDHVVLESNNMGYNIFVPATLINQIPGTGSDIKIHTYMLVREDAINLYGFLAKEDLRIFKLLIGVSGIGPKGALAILSTITPDNLRFAVLAGDSKAISKAPGIGSKTAQKLIIELKDKLDITDVIGTDEESMPSVSGDNQARTDAILALTSLGYSQSDAARAVGGINVTENMNTEDILKEALKKML